MHRDKVLYHFSEEADITSFAPRFASPELGKVVWAISEAGMYTYLLPRDCPRVTFRADDNTSQEDVHRFFGQSSARYIVAIESDWLAKVRATTLYRYHLPADRFRSYREDSIAQYYVSHQRVTPLSVEPIADLLQALTDFGVELRIMPSLWRLYDAVVDSTLAFSIIRMRHSLPRDTTMAREGLSPCKRFTA